MRQLCADAGVAVALVREMKKVPWNGATKWLSPDKVMILLSLRGKGEDKFWFSFFHEAGHVLKDNKKEVFFINDESESDLLEQQADTFAAEKLIPSKHNARVSRCRSKQDLSTRPTNWAFLQELSPGGISSSQENGKRLLNLSVHCNGQPEFPELPIIAA